MKFADVTPNLDFRVIPTLHFDPAGDVGDLHHAMRLYGQTLLKLLRVRQPCQERGTQHKHRLHSSKHDQIPSPELPASCTAVSTRISSW